MAVDISVDQHVATIVLNRPEALNAYDPEMKRELQQAWETVRCDDDVWVGIITGAGERAFCSGQDIKKTHNPPESFAALMFGRSESDHLVSGLVMDKPWICAINGLAYGGGLEIALACDIRVAAESAKFALPEVKIAGIPGAGGTQRLPRLIGMSTAMRMLLTGAPITAAEAYRVGLVSEVVPLDRLMPLAREIAGQIVQNAPLSVRAVKRLVRLGMDMPLPNALEVDRFVSGLMRDTEDRAEGRKAFREKRKPVYRGR